MEKELRRAASRGDLHLVKSLVEKQTDVNSASKSGFTPLMGAASRGSLEVAKYLVSCGATINVTEAEEDSALLFAARRGHTPVVRFLVEKGATNKRCALFYAVGHLDDEYSEGGHLDTMIYLLKQMNGINMKELFNHSLLTGYPHILEYLLSTGKVKITSNLYMKIKSSNMVNQLGVISTLARPEITPNCL